MRVVAVFLSQWFISLLWAQQGSLDTTFNHLNVGLNTRILTTVRGVVVQPDGKVIVGGSFVTCNSVDRKRIARLNADGSVDVTFDPGAGTDDIIHAVALQPDGKVLIAGEFHTVNNVLRKRIARLNSDGSLDMSFDPGSGASGTVYAVTVLPGGGILLGGYFSSYNGVSCSNLIRLSDTGTLDPSFDGGAGPNAEVHAIVLHPDGHVFIGGAFTAYDGTPRSRVARLQSDGALDTTFDPGDGPGGPVLALARQVSGQVLVGGEFLTVAGNPRRGIARFNEDGSWDSGFGAGNGATGSVEEMALQSDGKIFIVGDFVGYNGTSRSRIARLFEDGMLDASFDTGTGVDDVIHAVALQSDGEVIIGGSFSSFNDDECSSIARLSGGGLRIIGPEGPNYGVRSIIRRPDGRLLVGGSFSTYNDSLRRYIALVNEDGTLEPQFNIDYGPSGAVYDVALQADGKVLIAGAFTSFDGTLRSHIARLHQDGSLDLSFGLPTQVIDDLITSISVQDDQKIIVSGNFITVHGASRSHIARLNTDGSLDLTFLPGYGANDVITQNFIRPGGRIVIVGLFTNFDGSSRGGIAELLPDGNVSSNFGGSLGSQDGIRNIVPTPDGKFIITGDFNTYDNDDVPGIARVNLDGTLDDDFNYFDPASVYGFSPAIVQADGKVIVAVYEHGIHRLNIDGSLDPSFFTVGDGVNIDAMVLQPDGRLVVGGVFSCIDGTTRGRLARLICAEGNIGVEDLHVQDSNELGLFPDPAQGAFAIAGNTSTLTRVRLVNAMGSTVRQWQAGISYDLSGIKPGLYSVIMSTNDAQQHSEHLVVSE